MTRDGYRTVVGDARPELDRRLSDELDGFNAAATTGTPPARRRTKPTRGSQERRIEAKKQRGQLKKQRRSWD